MKPPLRLGAYWSALLACAFALRATKPKDAKAASTAGAASAVLEKLGSGQCGAIRFNYKCEGGPYESFLETHGAELESIYAKARAQPFTKNVLFVGNSHIREVAEAYLCQRHELVESWSHLGPDGCLRTSPYAERCDGAEGTDCKDEVSRATLRGGGSVYVAVNHPWIYKGRQGLVSAFGLLGLDVRKLDVVVVGAWNSQPWARKKFLFEHAVPLCGGSGGLFGLFDVEPMAAVDLAESLQTMGFSGQMVLGGQFETAGAVPPLPIERLARYNFSVRSLAPFPLDCASAECGRRSGHQCLPGPPDFVADEIDRGR